MGSPAARLQQQLGLSDEELCRVLDADPLSVVAGELDHRPELGILLDLLADPLERLGPKTLGRWLRSNGPDGRPIDHLLVRDFAAFEDALTTLEQRGFILRGS